MSLMVDHLEMATDSMTELAKENDDLETRIAELIEHLDNAHRSAGKMHRELHDKHRIRVGKLRLQDSYTRSQITKALRLDDSHGPMPASLEFIVQTVEALMRQVTVSPNAKFASEPMVKSEHDCMANQVAELTTERDRAIEDLHRLTDAFECSDHPDALHMVRCTACGNERHVPA